MTNLHKVKLLKIESSESFFQEKISLKVNINNSAEIVHNSFNCNSFLEIPNNSIFSLTITSNSPGFLKTKPIDINLLRLNDCIFVPLYYKKFENQPEIDFWSNSKISLSLVHPDDTNSRNKDLVFQNS